MHTDEYSVYEKDELWFDSRNFEVVNTTHALWHVKDVESLDDLQFEFSLRYAGPYGAIVAIYQVGYYGAALRHFKEWVIKHGLEAELVPGSKKKILKVLKKNRTLTYCGNTEIAEKLIEEDMKVYKDYKREDFKIEEVDL